MPSADQTPVATARAGGGATLRRGLGLWHAVLYGLGVTIGAGIYVLIGPASAKAGMAAPIAFVVAAVLMVLTAASFAELAGRMPVAAGEAAYVEAGFRSSPAGTAVGLLVVGIAIATSAAISVGSAGYILDFVDLPAPLVVAAVVLAMGAVAAWGIVESVTFAGIMTLIEVGGLLLIVALGAIAAPGLVDRLPEALPPLAAGGAWRGVLAAGLLAVFAFIGFEGIVNIAEEVESPARTLPRAIFITLALATVLYIVVTWVALVAVGPAELARSPAPLTVVFERLAGMAPWPMSAIAIVATLNGIIVSMIMASRVLYGLAARGQIWAPLATVSPLTRTPLLGTGLTVSLVLALALAIPLEGLAELSSRLTLAVFALVNLSLVLIRWREVARPSGIYRAPLGVPHAGFLATVLFLLADAFS
ncbi:MAG: amino acid permease [Pseudomonadota bacterium]